ncbi:MAG TPA: phage/plasmid primase, P4 family, partial [Tepidisphaeraceae bacterium]|jgi:putative DNA primase/helicase
MGAMGTYAAVGTDNLLIQKPSSDHPAELAGLRGKRLVVVNETDENARLKIQTVKRLTGDSTVKARVMRGDPFEFRRTFKPWLVTNNKPVINENSEAIWRRVRLIPFTMKLADAAKDATLPERLKKEYANILAWAVKGCQAWLERGMSPPSKVLVATSTYRDNSDTFSDVVERCFVIGDVGKVKVSRRDSYAAYLADASSMAVKWPLSDRALFERLRALPGVSEDEWKDHGQKIRGFRGIGLLHPSASRPAPLPDPELEAAL